MTIEVNGSEELIQIAKQNGWTIDYADDGSLKVIDDKNSNEWIYTRDGGLQVNDIQSTSGEFETVSTDETRFTHPDSSRRLELESRTDLRPSYDDSLDLYLHAPNANPGGGDATDTDLILENGIQIDVRINSDLVDGISEDYTSERLKFLESGGLDIETDVPGELVSLSSENGGGVLIRTTDGGNNGKNKVDRLKVNGNQRDLETAEWRAMDYVRFQEWPKNSSHAGRIALGLNDAENGNGSEVEFTGSKLRLNLNDSGDVFAVNTPDGNEPLQVGSGEVDINSQLDLNNQLVKNWQVGYSPSDASTVQDYARVRGDDGATYYFPLYQ